MAKGVRLVHAEPLSISPFAAQRNSGNPSQNHGDNALSVLVEVLLKSY